MSRFLDSHAQPWGPALIEQAIFKNARDAKESIENTLGGRVWRELSDLEDSVWAFQANTTALLDEIRLFGEHSEHASFWHDVNGRAELHTREVKRLLFNCTSSLMALVEHARAFHKSFPVSGYSDQLALTFSTPGLHEFLQCLRNYGTHWRIAQTHWIINHDLVKKTRTAEFVVRRPELLSWGGWTAGARQFIDSAREEISVYGVFAKYRDQVERFYGWHRGRLLDEYATPIRIHLEHKRLHDGLQKKYSWGVVIAHVPKGLNPYQYLSRYLTPSQLELLLTYEHRSPEQVDALIEMVGMTDFCDGKLRDKLLALFRLPHEA